MKKITAILLAVVLVACCFATVATVSAADENLLLGASYTVTTDATLSETLVDTDNKLLTNGAYRGDGTNAFNGIYGVTGVSVEYVGSNAITAVDFAFEDATTIGALVVKSARVFFLDASVNRHLNVKNVEVTTDGLVYTAAEFTVDYVAIEGAPECETADKTATGPQYHDVVINVAGATDIMGIKVTFDTVKGGDAANGYILQLDEIEGYANAISGDTSDDATSDDATSDDATSDDATSDDATSDDVTSDDATSDDAPAYTNVALGRPYTYANSENAEKFFGDSAPDEDCKLLTDGVVRKLFQLTSGGAPIKTITTELAGTTREHFITLNLDGLNTIDKVVLDGARRGGNRFCNIKAIEVSVKGGEFVPVTFTEEKVAIEGAGQYSIDDGVTNLDQFFTLNANFDAIADVTAVRVTLNTDISAAAEGEYAVTGRGYIVQLDEIMVMGTRTGDFGDSNNGGSTGNTGDLGLGIFAVLAVVSLAGVVVAKKVK